LKPTVITILREMPDADEGKSTLRHESLIHLEASDAVPAMRS
jgi:hypothetical protein